MLGIQHRLWPRASTLWLSFALLFYAATASATPDKITIFVTVDWEGWMLEDENLEAMRAFRTRYPNIPLLQLLNPVYFTRPNADSAEISSKIRSTMLPGDGQGLHLHGWKSLLRQCGLPYRSAPAYDTVSEECEGGECGYTVSLELAYSEAELTRLLACSSEILTSQGFKRPRSFRAGGWQLGPKLAAALQANGFRFDSSRTAAALLAPRWGENGGLVRFVRQLHPDSTPLDQPYELLPGLMEFPNNASLADYTSAQKLLQLFRDLIAHEKTVMVLGFHQETAASYLSNLEEAIPLLEQEARANGVKLEWARYPE